MNFISKKTDLNPLKKFYRKISNIFIFC